VASAGGPAVRFVRVLESGELAEGHGRQLVVDGRSVAVFRHQGVVYAMDGICPHAGSPLGPGLVAHGMVECPWHGWRFRFADGTSPDVEGLVQTTYPAREEAGAVFVGIPDDDGASES
jgi:nitrite reductase/ring-hydroxylating ferredoxin subunit